MNVLGLSFGFHDSAAALIVDGNVVAACQQERISRVKNDAGFPGDAASWCLNRAGITSKDLSLVCYHEVPLLKFDRIVESSRRVGKVAEAEFQRTVARWLRDGRFAVKDLISRRLGVEPDRVAFCRHHDSHAASAFYSSPFERATIVTLDGVGEYETAVIAVGEGTSITRIASVQLPHSIGLFYSAFTAFLGFQVNEGEYKVMGMAAYGKPRHSDSLTALFKLNEDGTFEIDQSLFAFDGMSDRPYTAAMSERFGPPRVPHAPFGLDPRDLEPQHRGESEIIVEASKRYADIAASVQAVTEEVILHVVRRAVERTGCRNVVLAGGVALNSLANGRLVREEGYDVFVQPAAGDAGCALGAAQHHWHQSLNGPRTAPLVSCALGRDFSREECRAAVERSGFKVELDTDDRALYLDAVARLLSEGKVVGWFDGRSEWGPRALGQRSILADPRRQDMQRIVNEKVKFREAFRPFAPAVPQDAIDKYFEIYKSTKARRPGPGSPESFMLAVHPVRPECRSALPAITHADGTARVQSVSPDTQPVFHMLLQAFGRVTGVPILVNTSFNLNGEPIVDTPDDAIRTFSLSGIDCLAIEGIIVSKELAGAL